MPETKTPSKAVPRKPPTAHKRPAPASKPVEHRITLDRTTELSDEVLKSLESGQRAAIEAVRKFVDTVDEILPALEHPSKRQGVVDAAMDMADKLVHTQYDFLRKVVQSAGKTLGKPTEGK
jgi:hypothetical protein